VPRSTRWLLALVVACGLLALVWRIVARSGPAPFQEPALEPSADPSASEGARKASEDVASPAHDPEVLDLAPPASVSPSRREPLPQQRPEIRGRVVLPADFVHGEEQWVVTGSESDLERLAAPIEADGSFALSLPVFAPVELRLESRFLWLPEPVSASPGQDVELRPCVYGSLEGRLVAPAVRAPGADLAKARLRWNFASLERPSAPTMWQPSWHQDSPPGPDGTFVLDKVASGVPLLLHVRNPFGPNTALEVAPLRPGEVRVLDVELEPGIRIEGVVLDEHDVPVPHVPLDVGDGRPVAERDDPWYSGRPLTDANGRFRIERVGLGVDRIATSGRDLVRHDEAALDPMRGDVLDLVLRVVRGGAITGRVTWPDGSRPEKIQIELVGPRNDWREAERGHLELRGLPSGRYELRVRATRAGVTGLALETNIEPGGPPLALVLSEEQGCEVSGRVVDEDETPVEYFSVYAHQEGGDSRAEPAEGRAGRFHWMGLTPGSWVLTVRAYGFVGQRVEVQLLPGTPQDLQITLVRGGTIRGRVLDESGNPVSGAWVGEQEAAFAARFHGAIEGTDAEGRFELELDDRRIHLMALTNEHGPSEVVELDVAPGQTLEGVELRLRNPCRVRGRVLDEEGRPLAGAEVRASSLPYLDLRAVSDTHGRFELVRLPPGRHWIGASHAARPGALAGAPIEVSAEREGALDLRFQGEDPVRVHGRVTHGGRAWTGTLVLLSSTGHVLLEVHADGSFATTLRRPGLWTGGILLGGALGQAEADLRRWDLLVPDEEELGITLELEQLPRIRRVEELWH